MECKAGPNQASTVDVPTLVLVLEEWIISLLSEQMSEHRFGVRVL